MTDIPQGISNVIRALTKVFMPLVEVKEVKKAKKTEQHKL